MTVQETESEMHPRPCMCPSLGFLELAHSVVSGLLLSNCCPPPDLRGILRETNIFGRQENHRTEVLDSNVKLEGYAQV